LSISDSGISGWAGSHATKPKYSESQLKIDKLFTTTKDFLISHGLPDSCPPFLNFYDYNTAPIPTVNQHFDLNYDDLNEYLVIGFNGCGDPICVDLSNDNSIVYLNHDNDFEVIFMNSTLPQLIDCTLTYYEFVEAERRDYQNLKQQFQLLDYNCVAEYSHWNFALECLEYNDDN
jgi:hypothetical protein